ncbi:MAG TPA: hypothetical protein VN108_09400 [Marmoricola sp.]|nr:hypothetical protein [Marmoricola sp.]
MTSNYSILSRQQLAVLVPELLLIGHLFDRAGMPYALGEWGEEEMAAIAIEEWECASPIYTRRMQKALGYEGEDIITIFKGLQLDIGAPPQFMDFRYEVADRQHGAFHLDHCGALLDVEPMGESMVRKMCHDIEDPTFDATAVATNPKAQVRPIHRPPRTPADRNPHCAWTVNIEDHHPDAVAAEGVAILEATRIGQWALDPVDQSEPGAADYSGDLVSDIDFASFSHSALVRMADEVVIQMHLLYLSFARAIRKRAADDATFERIVRNAFTGHAGIAAERITRALGLTGSIEDVALVMAVHPALNPASYVAFDQGALALSPAHEDGAGIALVTPEHPEALQAIARGVNPRLHVDISGTTTDWSATITESDEAPEHEAVAISKFSLGATFEFQPRQTLPLFVV